MANRLRDWLTNGFRRPKDRTNIAILIDGDGISPAGAAKAVQWVEQLGRVDIVRAYGNFSGKASSEWAQLLKRKRLVARHLPSLVSGKNASDIALAIDAVELLLTRPIDTFVLIVSDTDYTPLVLRLRESGKVVLGIGQAGTPETLRLACTEFHVVKSLSRHVPTSPKLLWTRKAEHAEDLVLNALAQLSSAGEPASLSRLSNALREQDTLFDPRVYNHGKLIDLLNALPSVEVLQIDGEWRVRARTKSKETG